MIVANNQKKENNLLNGTPKKTKDRLYIKKHSKKPFKNVTPPESKKTLLNISPEMPSRNMEINIGGFDSTSK